MFCSEINANASSRKPTWCNYTIKFYVAIPVQEIIVHTVTHVLGGVAYFWSSHFHVILFFLSSQNSTSVSIQVKYLNFFFWSSRFAFFFLFSPSDASFQVFHTLTTCKCVMTKFNGRNVIQNNFNVFGQSFWGSERYEVGAY